jgi:hypothetical protein
MWHTQPCARLVAQLQPLMHAVVVVNAQADEFRDEFINMKMTLA